MKNISIKIPICLAATIILSAACTEKLADKSTDDTHAIAFAPATETRAAVNGSGNLGDFKVWGWYGTPDAINKNVFDGKTIKAPLWTYDGGYQYWIPGNTYNFYGVYPAGLTGVEVNNTGEIKVTGFDCSATGAEAVDLMTAKNTGITYTSGSLVLPVEMNFSHELAKLNFIVKSESDAVEVTQFKVFNVIYNGTLLGSSWNTFEKNTQGDNIYNSSSFILNINDGLSKNVFGDVLIIPHDNANLLNANVLISYKYSGEQEIKTQTLSLVVDNVIENWSSGQSYSYSLTIKPNGITFSGLKADEWSETSSGGNIPIE